MHDSNDQLVYLWPYDCRPNEYVIEILIFICTFFLMCFGYMNSVFFKLKIITVGRGVFDIVVWCFESRLNSGSTSVEIYRQVCLSICLCTDTA